MSTIAELESATKSYGEIIALNNITLRIPRNEILTIIGPNGSGKTTLLKILACIEKPTKGTLCFNGERVNERNIDRLRLKSTMVFQKTTLFNTTVYKNITYGLTLRGLSKREIAEKIREVLKIVKLEGYERRFAKKLSGGEQQRVSLARAIALETDLLLLDEPTANLDQRNTSIMEAAISHIRREKNTTIVLSTHNMLQIGTLSEKVALLINGELVNVGKPHEILNAPKKLADFARIENLFSGNSCATQEGTTIIDVGGNVQIEAAAKTIGRASIFIRPEDIILSKTKIESSARNVFEGKIVEISDLRSLVKLKIDVGKPFVVQITKRSFNEMQLGLSSKIFIAFKASSVHVLD